MTAITRNLPRVVRDLGVAIVGERCYVSLVENLNVGDTQCLKFALSKGLGIGIVVGGSIMKVPQILLIVNAKSARGLSFPAYVLETLSYAITLAYSFRHNFPFSTYGENLFLTLQNVIITFLILIYAPGRFSSQKLVPLAIGTVGTAAALYTLPLDKIALLQATTLPLSLFSKLPQIRQNARSQSTGQLSAFAVISQVLGCLARLFTTATEVGDSLVAAGFALALLLNIVLGFQLWSYWGNSDKATGATVELKTFRGDGEDEKSFPEIVSPAPRQFSPAPASAAAGRAYSPNRLATPPPRAPSATGSKKWARKVD